MERISLDIKKEYDQICSTHPNPDFHKQVLEFWLAAMLRIWGSNELYAPEYARLVSDVTGKSCSMEQIITGMACCSDPKRDLLIPDFLRVLVDSDIKNGTELAKEQIEKMNGILVSSAMVNGDFTIEEATCVSSIIKSWIRYASASGIKVPNLPDYISQITPKNEMGYYVGPTLNTSNEKELAQSRMVPFVY